MPHAFSVPMTQPESSHSSFDLGLVAPFQGAAVTPCSVPMHSCSFEAGCSPCMQVVGHGQQGPCPVPSMPVVPDNMVANMSVSQVGPCHMLHQPVPMPMQAGCNPVMFGVPARPCLPVLEEPAFTAPIGEPCPNPYQPSPMPGGISAMHAVENGPNSPGPVSVPAMPCLQSNLAFQPCQPSPMSMHSGSIQVGCMPAMPAMEVGPHGPCLEQVPDMPCLQSNLAFQPCQPSPMSMHSGSIQVGCMPAMPAMEVGPHGPCLQPVPAMPCLQSSLACQPSQPPPMSMHSGSIQVGCMPAMPAMEVGPHGPCLEPVPAMPCLQVSGEPAFTAPLLEPCSNPCQPPPMPSHGITEVGCSQAMPVVEQAPNSPCPVPPIAVLLGSMVANTSGEQALAAPQVEPYPDCCQPSPLPMHSGNIHAGCIPTMPDVQHGPPGPCLEPVQAMPSLPSCAFTEPCPKSIATGFKEPEFHVHQWLADQAVACTPASGPLAAAASSSSVTAVVGQVALPATQPKQETCASIVRPSEDLGGLALRPCLVHIPDCTTLAATVETNSGQCLWEWNRVTDGIDLKDMKGFRFFSLNKEKHASELIAAEIGASQIQYKGWGDKGRGEHSVGSAALVMLLTLISNTKPFSAQSKAKAIKLMVGLVQLSVAALEMAEGCPGICYGADGRYHERHLRVGATGVVEHFESLLLQHKGFTWAWGHLMLKGFCGHKIVSAQSHPCLWDILVFLAWAKNFPSARKVWPYLGQLLWPKIIFLCSRIMDRYAYLKSLLPLQAAPLLKSRKGRNRKTPWQNKLIFLKKMRKVRHHRKISATSHDDLLPSNCMLVSAEEKLVTGLYSKKIRKSIKIVIIFVCPGILPAMT